MSNKKWKTDQSFVAVSKYLNIKKWSLKFLAYSYARVGQEILDFLGYHNTYSIQ